MSTDREGGTDSKTFQVRIHYMSTLSHWVSVRVRTLAQTKGILFSATVDLFNSGADDERKDVLLHGSIRAIDIFVSSAFRFYL